MVGKAHEPPVTVPADEALPLLADPVDSEVEALVLVLDDPVLVVVIVVVEEDADPLDVEDAPAWVCAAATAIAATAIVPATPEDIVSLRCRRRALSRSATVMRRFCAAISAAPGNA